MSKYILVWNVDDYAEMGGGIGYEMFNDTKQLHRRAKELLSQDDTDIFYSGEVKSEFIYEAVERVTEYIPKLKKIE